jgi:hypothetical protein
VKYVIMFTSTPELDAAVSPEHAEQVYRRVYEWFGTHADQISDNGAELQPVTTATTVTHGGGAPVVTDGPFSEAKEVIGGFTILDVADLDAAIAVAARAPAAEYGSVDIRPMVGASFA